MNFLFLELIPNPSPQWRGFPGAFFLFFEGGREGGALNTRIRQSCHGGGPWALKVLYLPTYPYGCAPSRVESIVLNLPLWEPPYPNDPPFLFPPSISRILRAIGPWFTVSTGGRRETARFGNSPKMGIS